MAKVNIGLQRETNKLEVGDIIINQRHGARMVIGGHDKFFGVDLGNGQIYGSGETLSELEDMYCVGNFRILKSADIVVSEVGGRK